MFLHQKRFLKRHVTQSIVTEMNTNLVYFSSNKKKIFEFVFKLLT